MTLDIHNWSSSVHQEIYKIVKDEFFPIVNQVNARVQNFKIQFLKEAAKFVQDFKSLVKEADESLAKHKALELEIERLLRAVVTQDIMSIVQNPSVVDSSNLQTELERTKERFENGISHQASSVRTPQQNGVVERRNRMLVEAARTMLIFSRASLFLWDEKTDISFLHVFGALCYPKNDHEDIGKLGAKGDIGFFIGYSTDSCAYRVYNRRTKKIIETMNVTFDEISAMDFEQSSSKLGLQSMTSRQISSGLDLTYAPSTITTQQPTEACRSHVSLHGSATSADWVPLAYVAATSAADVAEGILTLLQAQTRDLEVVKLCT
ncbi:retrovirus-related pol polyprotein from transposon TNT 1-94 [Tanacetum coccineum]